MPVGHTARAVVCGDLVIWHFTLVGTVLQDAPRYAVIEAKLSWNEFFNMVESNSYISTLDHLN